MTATHTYAASPDGPWLLYDDVADPFQMRNRVDDPGAREMRAHLDGLLQKWLDRTGDDFSPAPVIAERFLGPDQVNSFVPIPPLEPVINEGQKARATRSY